MVLKIDRSSTRPLQVQIYEQLRALIAERRLKPGAPMMATRQLAEQLGVSRTTALLAHEQLIAEGYLQTRPGVGTFVSSEPPADAIARRPGAGADKARRETASRSERGGGAAQMVVPAPPAIDFDPRHFDGQLFPLKVWRKLILPSIEHYRARVAFDPPPGLECLRRAIADWLIVSHGIAVPPEQIVIVSNRHQAYYILARHLAPRGSRVVVECTCPDEVARALASQGAELVPVPVDEHGLDVDRLPHGPVTLTYVAPMHQYPVGGTLPPARRKRLIAWARQAGSHILEDECGSGVWYRGVPPAPLQALDVAGTVVFVGDFTSTLGPGLRLAYMVVPPELVAPMLSLKALVGNGPAWLEQVSLAKFIESGGFARHLRRVRKIHLARRDGLWAALRQHFGEVRLAGTEAGAHVAWFLPPGFPPAPEVRRLARASEVGVCTLPDLVAEERAWCENANHTLFLGYGALSEADIRKGVADLAEAIAPRTEGTGNRKPLRAA